MRSLISVCLLCHSDALTQSLLRYLSSESSKSEAEPQLESTAANLTRRYSVAQFSSADELVSFISDGNQHIDCLVLEEDPSLEGLFEKLHQQSAFFPAVIVQTSVETILPLFYHAAMQWLSAEQPSQINLLIERAISQFVQLPLVCRVPEDAAPSDASQTTRQSLMEQQLLLTKKLKARLGYLGVYYKRNPQNFLRHMPPPQRQELLRQLRADYRQIILDYFSEEPTLNQQIDNFVNTVFFSDVPVAQIVEIHMELMDEFSKQLKLEGRSDEILLDYRLTLIDTIAHLCEMYRRSIPRES